MTADTALFVIDMQHDFLDEGTALHVRSAHAGLAKLAAFVERCRARGMPIVFTRHTYHPDHNRIEAQLFPDFAARGLREGTPGWQIPHALAPHAHDIVVDKRRYDAFFGTKLEEILRAKGVTTVIITGTMTEVCCESTARGAMMRDFEVLFTSDLTFTRDARRHEQTLDVIRTHFGWVKTSEELQEMNFYISYLQSTIRDGVYRFQQHSGIYDKIS